MLKKGNTTKTGSRVLNKRIPTRLDGTRKWGTRTWYRGTLFRSRLESFWAEAFDGAGLRWSYEPMEFILGNRTYLPDFYLADLDAYAEVKPAYPDPIEYALCSALQLETRCRVFCLIGRPEARDCLEFLVLPFMGREVSVGVPSEGPLYVPRRDDRCV